MFKRSKPIDIKYKDDKHYNYALSLKSVSEGFPNFGKQATKAPNPNAYIESLKLLERLENKKRIAEKIDVFGYPLKFFNHEEYKMKKLKRTKSYDNKCNTDNINHTISNFFYGKYNKDMPKKLRDNYIKREPSPKHFIDVDDNYSDDSNQKLENK
jgi:hypothetical protein